MTYKGLLSATHEAETKWTQSKVPAMVKGANVKECKEEGTTKLKSKIDSLTAILKASNFRTNKLQGGEKVVQGKPAQKGWQGKSKSIHNTPLKRKGPGTSAAGPFKGNWKPIQCYNCGGWGHRWRECPSNRDFNWRELSRAQASAAAVSTSPKSTTNKQ